MSVKVFVTVETGVRTQFARFLQLVGTVDLPVSLVCIGPGDVKDTISASRLSFALGVIISSSRPGYCFHHLGNRNCN